MRGPPRNRAHWDREMADLAKTTPGRVANSNCKMGTGSILSCLGETPENCVFNLQVSASLEVCQEGQDERLQRQAMSWSTLVSFRI